MEDRYEIRGKIGQGGVGVVLRGYDLKMNREVAIKRIGSAPNDPELQQEFTRQLIKEAGALASLQHPHIVTIYDVGSDEDGPFVVMELIHGKTLDELIERAPLTWPDFREMAMQTQEALIAAQERNLIHSDLKPSNLMLTWLPSGKFQIKIVDFGLATLAQSQSKQELEALEAVFGSIFFMPPEQFERNPLDMRSDMYSIGCVYYQALTGTYPFTGTTGNEVMEAHLNHRVKLLKEVRGEIPLWVCDWIMWHMNRNPEDRPSCAKEALSIFLKNDRIPNPQMSLGYTPMPAAAGPPRIRRAGPPGAAPGQHQEPQRPAQQKTAPMPLLPPEGFGEIVHTAMLEPPAPTAPPPTTAPQQVVVAPPPKKDSSKNIKIGAAVATGVLVLVMGMFMFKSGGKASFVDELSAKVTAGATQIDVNRSTLDKLLTTLAKSQSNAEIQKIGQILKIAKASDSTNVDTTIANFVIKSVGLSSHAKEVLITDVLRVRKNPAIQPMLLELISSSDDSATILAALQAMRDGADESNFDQFLKIIETATDNQVREAAALNIEAILRKSKGKDMMAKKLNTAYASNVKPDVLKTLRSLVDLSKSLR